MDWIEVRVATGGCIDCEHAPAATLSPSSCKAEYGAIKLRVWRLASGVSTRGCETTKEKLGRLDRSAGQAWVGLCWSEVQAGRLGAGWMDGVGWVVDDARQPRAGKERESWRAAGDLFEAHSLVVVGRCTVFRVPAVLGKYRLVWGWEEGGHGHEQGSGCSCRAKVTDQYVHAQHTE